MADEGLKTKITISVLAAVVVAFLAGGIGGVMIGTRAWRDGCVAKIDIGSKFFESDCSEAGHQGSLIDFANAAPLPLDAALQRIAEITGDKSPQRVFHGHQLANTGFGNQKVHPPAGSQRSLKIVHQLLTEAQASEDVDICIVPDGYALRQRVRSVDSSNAR